MLPAVQFDAARRKGESRHHTGNRKSLPLSQARRSLIHLVMRSQMRPGYVVLGALVAGTVAYGTYSYLTGMDSGPTGPRVRPNEIIIEQATYGQNCIDAKSPVLNPALAVSGNATFSLWQACTGKRGCSYRVDVDRLGDTAPGCHKDFRARWICEGEPGQRHIEIAGEAHRNPVNIYCDSTDWVEPNMIVITQATYGENCFGSGRSTANPHLAVSGNATYYLWQACTGKRDCSYKVRADRLGDPARGCKKDLRVKWICKGAPQEHQLELAPEAHGQSARIACGSEPGRQE